jgi:hypothetical protein
MAENLIPAFQNFIDGLRAIWAHEAEDEKRMKKAQSLMEETLLQDQDFLQRSKDWPSTEGRKNLLFYTDPEYGFVINGVVREPGRKGSVHDHADAWVLYGLLDGTETLERFDVVEDRRSDGYAKVVLTSAPLGRAGKADLVGPYEVHAEQGSNIRSVAVILRSRELVGKILQGRYNRETGEYFEGSGPEQIPYALNL